LLPAFRSRPQNRYENLYKTNAKNISILNLF
jgi:hypothetical protein